MTACKLLAEGGPNGTIRAYCPDCGFVALLELPASVDVCAAWTTAQARAHRTFRTLLRDTATRRWPHFQRNLDDVPDDDVPDDTEAAP